MLISTPNEKIQIERKVPFHLLVFDVEVDVKSVEQLSIQICQQVLRHSNILISSVIGVWGSGLGSLRGLCRIVLLQGGLADLNSSWIERRVLILDRADKHNVFEPFEARERRQSIQACLLVQSLIRHTQLRQASRVAPLFQQPHAGVEELVRVVHVAEVRGAQTYEREELGSEFG